MNCKTDFSGRRTATAVSCSAPSDSKSGAKVLLFSHSTHGNYAFSLKVNGKEWVRKGRSRKNVLRITSLDWPQPSQQPRDVSPSNSPLAKKPVHTSNLPTLFPSSLPEHSAPPHSFCIKSVEACKFLSTLHFLT